MLDIRYLALIARFVCIIFICHSMFPCSSYTGIGIKREIKSLFTAYVHAPTGSGSAFHRAPRLRQEPAPDPPTPHLYRNPFKHRIPILRNMYTWHCYKLQNWRFGEQTKSHKNIISSSPNQQPAHNIDNYHIPNYNSYTQSYLP